MLLAMSSTATTRRARVAALALAATMVLTLAGGALLGTGSTGAPTPAQPAPTTEVVTDLDDLTDEELLALLAEYQDQAPSTEAPAPAP